MLQVLPHVNALLERAVSVFKATTTTNTTPQPLEKRETIYPGQTNALQWILNKLPNLLEGKKAV